MKYNIIVAMCKYNNGIGLEGALPWNIKEDLQYFSQMTKGKGNNAVIMGRNTYTSLKKAGLPGRDNFVLSSSLQLNFPIQEERYKMATHHTVRTAANIESVLLMCSANNYDTVWVIGGGNIYRQFLELKLIDKCYVTLIHKLFECDATFPLLDVAEWRIEKKTDLCKGLVLADHKGVVLADHKGVVLADNKGVVLADNKGVALADNKGIYNFKIECIEYSKVIF